MKVDLTNRKFGFLKALYPTTKRVQRKVVWRCECVCGKECEVLSTNLTSGRTVSCGCKKYEIVSKHYRDKSPKQGEIINGTKIVDTDYRPDNRGFNECYVLAECKFCGKEFWVRKASLENGNTKSCGCTRNSIGEATIQKILDENGIAYEREKIFKDCYFENIQNKCRFDFYIENSYLLEFDGIQHSDKYECGQSSWFNEEILKRIKERDKYKNEWCKQHNIPLIRIPHYKLDTLCIDDLLLDKTRFLVNKET